MIKPNEQAMASMRAVAQDLRIVAEANERASVAARAAILAMEVGDIAGAIDSLAEMVRIGVDIEPRIELLMTEWGRVSMLDPVAWSAAAPRAPVSSPTPAPARTPAVNIQADSSNAALAELARVFGLDVTVLMKRILRQPPNRAIEPALLLETVEECRTALRIHESMCRTPAKNCHAVQEINARIRQLGGAP